MSVMNHSGEKIVLERSGSDAFWQLVQDRYADDDPRKWRYLAMLALRENAAWSLELIGKAFGHHRGHVMRCLNQVRDRLRHELSQEPCLWDDRECDTDEAELLIEWGEVETLSPSAASDRQQLVDVA